MELRPRIPERGDTQKLNVVEARALESAVGSVAVVLALPRSIIDPDDQWNGPFDLIGDGDNTFTWTHPQIAEHLGRQWLTARVGCH